jgi:hypothetical protein
VVTTLYGKTIQALMAFDEYLSRTPPMGLVELLRNIQPVSHQTMMGNFDRHSCL